MKELVELIINYIIGNPNEIDIECIENSFYNKIMIKAPEEYIGKVIGKNGRIVKAIRLIANSQNNYKGKKIYVSIVLKSG